MTAPIPSPNPDRRGFFKRLSAVLIGAVLGLVPLASGFLMLFDPVRRRSQAGQRVKVTSLAALPADGIPRKFPVIASRTDAWNKSPQVPIGAVYLRRSGMDVVEAFNVVCPHAGCFVDFKPEGKSFLCPCHNSTFDLNGAVNDPKSPSPRGLDSLEAEVRNGEVWIQFQNFRAGISGKIPEA